MPRGHGPPSGGPEARASSPSDGRAGGPGTSPSSTPRRVDAALGARLATITMSAVAALGAGGCLTWSRPRSVVVRQYRAALAAGRRPPSPRTVFDSHRVLQTFLWWARAEGYTADPRILELKRPKMPDQEATVCHIAQVRTILAACKPKMPQEKLAVRILVGAVPPPRRTGRTPRAAGGGTLGAPSGLRGLAPARRASCGRRPATGDQ
jgi:hypothetical protein